MAGQASFVPYGPTHPFPIQNLPYGVFSTASDPRPRAGVAIGDCILDLDALSRTAHIAQAGAGVDASVLQQPTLNAFIAQPKTTWAAFRAFLQRILAPDSPLSKPERKTLLVDRLAPTTQLHLPIRIGDYTDFYSSLEHALNCGTLIRGKDNALQRNWKWLPVGYHGRASSVVVSGTPFHRPAGQILPCPDSAEPIFAPCRRLDFELEMGFVVGGPATQLGQRLSPADARDRLFGCMLLNDWSARDIQTWEYVPLGPFLSKNFCTTVSPWIVPCAALEPFRAPQYTHDPPLLAYLDDPAGYNYDVLLHVSLRPAGSAVYTRIATSSLKHTYFTPAQMLTHHTATGCPMNPADLLGTGTLSAPGENGFGSLLEKSRMGKHEFRLCTEAEATEQDEANADQWKQSTTRTFLLDGDSVRMTGLAQGDGYCIGFGDCEATVLPAHDL